MQDIRRIIFSDEELGSAFEAYSRKTPNFLPPGKIVSCSTLVASGSECAVLVRIDTSQESGPKQLELTFRNANVLQPLILFCLENNVMLPRQGRKSFSIVEGKACLIIDLNLEFDLGSEEAPMRSEDIPEIK
ncbi:MAG: hypothetical protein PHE27_01370 [Alphaproteobacteria bacterium]|nr:hypothetical protein [Alphaproteobacteria bacterium]